MTVSERTSGPDLRYRLIWPTEKAEADRSGPQGSLLKLEKFVGLLTESGSTRHCINLDGEDRKNWKYEGFKVEKKWVRKP